jgi:hypothetical protein
VIRRRRVQLPTVDLTPCHLFQHWPKEDEVIKGRAQHPPLLAAYTLGTFMGAGSVRGGAMHRALSRCEPYVDPNVLTILRPQFHISPEGQ